MSYKVTLLPGDGIGPEVSRAAPQIIAAAGVDIHWEVIAAPPHAEGSPADFPLAEAFASVRRIRVALKGPMTTGVALGPPSFNVALRRELNLYANLRPVRNMPGVSSRWADVDLV